MFRKSFQNNCYKLFSRFQQNFLLHFHNYFNSPHNFPILCKNSFLFRHSCTTTFFNLTKITRHYFCKTYKIFEKFGGVFTNIFHKFFKVSSQTSCTQRKDAEHILSFPSAVGNHRLAIFVYR